MRFNGQRTRQIRNTVLLGNISNVNDISNNGKTNIIDALLAKKDIDFLIVSTGSSNMEGWNARGNPNGQEAPDPRILGLNFDRNTMDFQVADIRTSSLGIIGGETEFREPMLTGEVVHRIRTNNRDRYNDNWTPQAFKFAQEYAKEHPTRKVGLVVHGVGGVSLAEWVKESGIVYQNVDNNRLVSRAQVYTDLDEIMKVALRRSKKQKADVMIWGCMTTEGYYTGAQVELMKRIIEQYRNESWGTKDMPMLFCHSTGSSSSTVNRNCDRVAAEVPNVFCINTDRLSGQRFEPWHYDLASVRAMGKMYYDAWKAMTED